MMTRFEKNTNNRIDVCVPFQIKLNNQLHFYLDDVTYKGQKGDIIMNVVNKAELILVADQPL